MPEVPVPKNQLPKQGAAPKKEASTSEAPSEQALAAAHDLTDPEDPTLPLMQRLAKLGEGAEKTEHPIRGKIKDIKQQVQLAKAEIKKLHDIRAKEAESPVNILGPHETKESVLAEVDEFLANPPKDPEQYMLASQRLIKRLNRQDGIVKEKREKDRATQQSKEAEYNRLKEEKDQIIEDAGGLIGPIRGRRLRAIEQKLFELEPDMPDPGELSWESQHYLEDSSISLRVQDLKRKQTEVAKKFTQEQIVEIAAQYDTALFEIQASGEISGEMMHVFFDELVIPEIDILGTIGEMSEPCVELFKRWVPQLRDAYAAGNINKVRGRMVQDIDEQHGGDKAGVFLLDESIYEGILHREGDKSVVQSFVTKLAMEDIEGILQEVEGSFGEGYRGRYPDTGLARELKMDLNESRREESGATSDTIRIGKEVYFDDVLTSIFASSESAREIFGADIMDTFAASRRERVLEHVGEASSVNTLRAASLDPTPEVVQKLILLSIPGGENSQFAQATLASVAQREEWPQLLGEVVAANPQMVQISEVFAESKVAGKDFAPQVKDALSDYMVEASAIGYKRGATPLEQSITLIIRPRLSANQSIELGQRLGVFNQEEVSTLSEAVAIVSEHTHDADGATHDGVFDRLVKDLVTNNIVTRREEFDRLLQVSRQIIAAKEDPSVVKSLTSKEFKELVFGKKPLDSPSFSKVLELVDEHPAIVTQEATRAIASHKDVFANPQGLTDLVAVIEAYADFDTSVVDLVGRRGLTVARALELPTSCPDLLRAKSFDIAKNNPKIYLVDDQRVEFFRQISQWDSVQLRYSEFVADSIRSGELTEESALLIPKHIPDLLKRENIHTLRLVIARSGSLIKSVADGEFINDLVIRFGENSEYFIEGYDELIKSGAVSPEDRVQFLDVSEQFHKSQTIFTQDRYEAFLGTVELAEGIVLNESVSELDRLRLRMDLACYKATDQLGKIQIISNLAGKLSADEATELLSLLRWIPPQQIQGAESLSDLRPLFDESMNSFSQSIQENFGGMDGFLQDEIGMRNLVKIMDLLTERLNLPTRELKIGELNLKLPLDFIHKFSAVRKGSERAEFCPELIKYMVGASLTESTAFTTQDILYSQIIDLSDPMGRRRDVFSAEELFDQMAENYLASGRTWATAIEYQKAQPESPLFIIANERTGPADLAAEHLDPKFAKEFGIAQDIDHDRFVDWLKNNRELIDGLYQKRIDGEQIDELIPQELKDILKLGEAKIIPLYRIKVPSSLGNASTEEPAGIEDVIRIYKLTSLLEGRTLFMDESTRSAPRSIECVVNALKRRDSLLGGVSMRFFGKIKEANGQSGTHFSDEVDPLSGVEAGFIDPWQSQIKPINDDSVGFVPEVSGTGVVEIERPSNTAASPFGVTTVQEMWKMLIAQKVSRDLTPERIRQINQELETR